jgi:hypothetical protein
MRYAQLNEGEVAALNNQFPSLPWGNSVLCSNGKHHGQVMMNQLVGGLFSDYGGSKTM